MTATLTDADLAALAARVLAHGPTRVLCDRSGVATTPPRACAEHGVVPTRVLVRRDGWTLGYPDWLDDAARGLWAGSWAAEIDLATGAVRRL